LKTICIAWLLLAVTLLFEYSVHGEDWIPPGQEAPEALFQAQIGDASVDFFISGAWQASLYGSIGILVGPDGRVEFPSSFPGLEAGPMFSQVPDLTLSVWLMERFFLEASVVGDFLQEKYSYFDQNYFLLGYRGQEEELLQHLLIGNHNLGIDPYPFVSVPEPGSSSLGAEGLLVGPRSRHQLLLRFDNDETGSLTYIGSNLVTEEEIELSGYLRGRFFKLPDAGVSGVEVYLEDPAGSYVDDERRHYRLATAADGTLDTVEGTVSLVGPATGSVLVYYTKGGAEVGDGTLGAGALAGRQEVSKVIDLLQPAVDFHWTMGTTYLGEDMDGRQVTVGGKTCLRLYRPGEFSPFEILGAYALGALVPEDPGKFRAAVVRKADGLEESGDLRIRAAPGTQYLSVYYGPALRDSFRNLYPFLDDYTGSAVFDPDNRLYGPMADADAAYLAHRLRVSWLTPVEVYHLGTDLVPGSVQVLRNGAAETRFEMDYETGVLTFLTPIGAEDRLEVSFRRRQSVLNNGDFLFAWGNTISLSEALSLEAAAGVRWNALPGAFTETPYARTGTVLLSAGLQGELGPLSYQVAAAGAYTNPDTTGVYRLLGMEQAGLEILLSEETAWPASCPADGTLDGQVAAGTVVPGNRGQLLYKDYREYGLAGTSMLQPYTWTPPPEQVYEYKTGSKPGPYVAAGSSAGERSGQSLVLDFDLGSGGWAGAQLPVLSQGGLSDLSAFESLSLSYRALDTSGSYDLYLQLGEVGEDLDGDGALDQELSAADAGFAFDDSANGATLRVGSGPRNGSNNRRDSEDIDGNGFLDGDGAGTFLVTRQIGSTISADTDWRVLEIPFTADLRARLRRTRALRLLVVSSGGASGRLLVDRITLAGSRFLAGWRSGDTIQGTDEVAAREIAERDLASPPATSLPEAFPEVMQLFHPLAEEEKVLELSWQSGAGRTAALRGYLSGPGSAARYRNLVYYYLQPAAGGDLLQFSIVDGEGRGIHWSYAPIVSPGWSRIRVSLEEGKIYRDQGAGEAEVAGGTVTVDPAYDPLQRFTAELDNATSGTLYLDELHLTDPRGSVGGAVALEAELSLPGELLRVGGYPLLHDLNLREQAQLESGGFCSLYGVPAPGYSLCSLTELGLGVSVLDLDLRFSLCGSQEGLSLGAGHRLELPNVSFPLRISDAFSLDDRAGGRELYRENTLTLALPPLLRLELGAAAGSLADTLTQSWRAALGLTPGPVSLQSRFDLSSAACGFAVPQADYFSNWTWGYGLLLPWHEENALARAGGLELDWRLSTLPVGVGALGCYRFQGFDFEPDGAHALKGTLRMELSLPLAWPETPGNLALEPGYRRSLELLDSRAAAGGVGTDFGGGLQALFGQAYAFRQPPYVELFAPQSEEDFAAATLPLQQACYRAESYLKLSRRFSSRLTDLVLPSSLELTVGKEFRREAELTAFTNCYELKSLSTAVNLFGRLGAYPLFHFYRTDELSNSLILTITHGSDTPLEGQLLLNSFVSIEAEQERTLTLDNRFSLGTGEEQSWSEGVQLVFAWSLHPPAGIRLPLLPADFGEQGYWSHSESLAVEVSGAGEAASYHPFNLILGHKSAAVLSDSARIEAEISTGLDVESTEAGQLYWRLGLKGGLSVALQF
jgi:hypothetical protein